MDGSSAPFLWTLAHLQSSSFDVPQIQYTGTLSHILWRTTSIHMSSHLLDETLVWHNSEQGIWSAMQSSTSSIIMENKQRHGIWSLLKALFSLCYYLCSSSNEVLCYVWSGFPSSWWLHICTVNCLLSSSSFCMKLLSFSMVNIWTIQVYISKL